MTKTNIYVHVHILLDIPITYRNELMICQSECTYLHKIVNIAVFIKQQQKNLPKRESTHVYIYKREHRNK